jgi:hypothetical protein
MIIILYRRSNRPVTDPFGLPVFSNQESARIVDSGYPGDVMPFPSACVAPVRGMPAPYPPSTVWLLRDAVSRSLSLLA